MQNDRAGVNDAVNARINSDRLTDQVIDRDASIAAANVVRFARVDLVGVGVACAVVTVINAVGVRSGLLWLVPAALVVMAAGLIVAIRLGEGGGPLGPIVAITAGHWVLAVVVPIALPFLWPIMVLVVVIPLVLAAPHVSLRVLVGMIAGAVSMSAAAAVLGLNADDRGAVPDIADGAELVIVVIALALLMVPIALVVWQNNRSQRRALDEALRLNEELVRSRRRVVEAGDVARRRIERDLHDGAQQRLAALGMRLRTLNARVGGGEEMPPDLPDALTGLIGEVDQTMTELRDLAHGVYPPILASHGLGAAFSTVARRSPGQVTIDDRCSDGPRPDRATEEALYFTGLEAVANAAKHAPDDPVELILDRTDGALVLVVTDQGPGFDAAAADDSHGLSNMRDRVESLSGRLTIDSAIGRGTTVTAEVPARSDRHPGTL